MERKRLERVTTHCCWREGEERENRISMRCLGSRWAGPRTSKRRNRGQKIGGNNQMRLIWEGKRDWQSGEERTEQLIHLSASFQVTLYMFCATEQFGW